MSEPAISLAVAALRREVGDRLYFRSGQGIALTSGGRRLAVIAGEMLGLADQAQRTVGGSSDEVGVLRVVATSAVAEHGGEALINAFAARTSNLEVTLEEEPGAGFAEILDQRRADLALGPRPGRAALASIRSVPCLRCRVAIVAAPGHPLARRRGIPASALSGERWLVGPTGIDTTTAPGRYLERHLALVSAEAVRAYASESAALAATAGGEGIMLAVGHAVREQIRARTLVVLDVREPPPLDLWHASTLPPDRCFPAALALQRFATTPEGVQAMFGARSWVPAARFRPPIHVTLWRSVADDADSVGGRPAGAARGPVHPAPANLERAGARLRTAEG